MKIDIFKMWFLDKMWRFGPISTLYDFRSIRVQCFSTRSNLTLVNENGSPLNCHREVTDIQDMKIVTFHIDISEAQAGQKYYCRNGDGVDSLNFLELTESPADDIMGEWSSWTSCQVVQKDRVSRTRSTLNFNREDVQSRYCRCSDLAQLPRPR